VDPAREQEKWAEDTWKHLHTTLRTISQARLKELPWVEAFNPEVASGPLDRIVAAQRAEPKPKPSTRGEDDDDGEEGDDNTYLVGYSMEHEAAWRVIEKGGRQMHKDYSQNIKLVPGENGEEVCEATWPDGFSAIIHDLPAEVFIGIQGPAAAEVQKKPAALLVSIAKKPASAPAPGMQTQDGQSIKIRALKDRNPLWQLMVGGGPKCQIRQDIDGAYTIMETIQKELSEGKVDIKGLYVLRDKLLEQNGVDPPRMCKKPATTAASSSADSAASPGGPSPRTPTAKASSNSKPAKRAKAAATSEPPPFLEHLW
jgi:hypothetical protein